MSPPPKLLGSSAHVRVAIWRRFVVTILDNKADEPSMQIFRDTFEAVQNEFPDGYYALTVVDGLPRGLFGAEARASVRDIMENYMRGVLASAVVIEGDEHYLTALRAMINLLTRALPQQDYDVRMEARVSRAVDWLAKHGAPDTAELAGVVRSLRQRRGEAAVR